MQVNCREVIWHWNVAQAPSTFETESSFLWLSPCAQKFSYRDHTGTGELMCWVRRVIIIIVIIIIIIIKSERHHNVIV